MAILFVYVGTLLVGCISIAFLIRFFCSTKSSSLILTNWPVFGILPNILYNSSRIHDFSTDLLQQNGGTFRFKGPGVDFLMTCDPANLNYILNTNFSNYQKGNHFREMFEVLGDGILAADSDDWRNLRRTVQSLFHDARFKPALERTVERKILNGLLPVLENVAELGNVIDLQDVFQRLTFDNICLLVLGFDPKCLSVDFPRVAIMKAYHDIEEAVLFRHLVPKMIWKLQRYLQIGKEKSLTKAWKISNQFATDHITRQRQKLSRTRENNNNNDNDDDDDDFNVLTYFLTSSADEENDISIKSDKFLSDMVFNLLTAGRDTIAAALSWFFWLVGTHPSVEEKLLEEMKLNLPTEKNGQKLTVFSFGELNKLVYLHAVVSEVLRLYPSLPINHIVSIDEDTLPSGHKIRKKLMVLTSFYSSGRMEEIWGKDCMEFKPERWISEKGEIIHFPSYKFVSFGAGPRACLGKIKSFNQIKAIASAILWNYCIQVVQDYPALPTPSVILYMKNSLKIRVSKRFAS